MKRDLYAEVSARIVAELEAGAAPWVRPSDEIRKWAVSILEGVAVDDLDDGMDSLNGYTSVFRGPTPELARYAGEDEEMSGLAAWLSALKTRGTKLDDVGVLASNRFQLDRLALKLKDAGIDTVRLQPNMADERNLPGVRLTTMHRAKGLEFQAVAIPFLDKSTFPASAALKSAVDEVDRRNILQQQKSLRLSCMWRLRGLRKFFGCRGVANHPCFLKM